MLSLIKGKKKIMQYCHCSSVDHKMTQITAYSYNEGSSRRVRIREVHNQFSKEKTKIE